MNKTKHANERCSQRGIKEKTINLLFKEGMVVRQNQGKALVIFPNKKKQAIEKKNLKIKNIQNAYMVILINSINLPESKIITIGHDYKNVYKQTLKKFH
ncbi:hypothetical protein N8823_02550 [Candidatus Pseudothioglobus singularis]|jgi:hypothetical protein|nr:hypothetical protein [Candidatus Pseudothioglobus singularis]